MVSQNNGKRQQVKDSVSDFCQTTTAHGVGRLAAHTDLVGRCIWVAFLLATYCGFVFHIYTLVARFLEAPALTSFTKSNPFHFPDVYVCSGSRLSASKMVQNITDGQSRRLKGYLECDAQCQKQILKFDIRSAAQLRSTEALRDTMEAVEDAFVADAFTKHYGNFADCRFTLRGEEFAGSTSHVTLYLPVSSGSGSAPGASVQLTARRECLAWREAARMLQEAGNPLGDKIESMDFSAGDRRCRSPRGLPLTGVAQYAKRQSLTSMGCYESVSSSSSTQQQHNCKWPLRSLEDCVQCCYDRQFLYTAVTGNNCSCVNSLADFGIAEAGRCSKQCSGAAAQQQQQFWCGSDTDSAVRSVYQVAQVPFSSLLHNSGICSLESDNDTLSADFSCYDYETDRFVVWAEDTCPLCCQLNNYRHFVFHCKATTEKRRCWCHCSHDPVDVGNRSVVQLPELKYNKPQMIDYGVLVVGAAAAPPLTVPYQSQLMAALQGPYCFFQLRGVLAASTCLVPYCAAPPQFDCVSSKGGSHTTAAATAAYTGSANRTDDWLCQPWRNIGNGMITRSKPFLDLRVLDEGQTPMNFRLRLPDGDSRNVSHRYCRAVEKLHEQDGAGFGDHLLSPVCAVHSTNQWWFELHSCLVKPCYESHPRITAAVRNTIGHQLLAQQFAAELSHELISCQFNGRRCSAADFTSFVHPQLGLCHKLNKTRADVTQRDQSRMELDMQFFVDSTDSFGFSLPNIKKLQDGVFKVMDESKMEADSEMQILLVPQDEFPWQSDAVRLDAGQHVMLQLRLDRTVRMPRSPNDTCRRDLGKISYNLTNWPADLRQSRHFAALADSEWSTSELSHWRLKMEKLRNSISNQSSLRGDTWMTFNETQQDCVSTKMLQHIVSQCRCLPEFFPIPASLSQHPRCFTSSDVGEMLATERCVRQQLGHAVSLQQQLRSQCQPACDSSTYRVTFATHPWPDLKPGQSLPFIDALAHGYSVPYSLRHHRGIGSLHFARMRAAEVESMTTGGAKTAERLVTFGQELQFLNSRLASVTVKAAGPLGQRVAEEPAYPAKNLLADLGGALGLWSGISVLTLCELIELIVHIVRVLRSAEGAAADEEDEKRENKAADAPEAV